MSGILSVDDYLASYRQNLLLKKTTTRTTVASMFFSVFDVVGNCGAGVLAGTNTANGVVPTNATAGYPPINAFVTNGVGYLSRVAFGNSVSCRLRVYDRVFVAGAYSFNANTTLASQPSYSARLPFKSDGTTTDYTGLELWAETVTAATGNQTWTVTYTDQDNNTGHTTGAIGISAAPTLGRCFQLPLASGDSGIRKVESVVGGTGSAGTANIMVLRPLWDGRIFAGNVGDTHDFLKTGLPQIFVNSGFYCLVAADSTSSGLIDLTLEVASKA